jgi:hypothetical protein
MQHGFELLTTGKTGGVGKAPERGQHQLLFADQIPNIEIRNPKQYQMTKTQITKMSAQNTQCFHN